VASTTGNTPTGSLGITIIPQLNVQPLVAGSYSDTLTVTLTPQ
jgi:spore coat protein U-like protein